MGRRQCTAEYKLGPINRKVRELLGAPAPDYRRVPRGAGWVEQWIGFSADEVARISDKRPVSYVRKRYPLLELTGAGGRTGWSRTDCQRFLAARGYGTTVKSACVGCPFHGNAQWRDMRDNRPAEWRDACAFDEAIRRGGARGLPLDGQAFLHAARVPLAEAPIDVVTAREWADAQGDLLGELGSSTRELLDVLERGDADGCSPYGCRSGAPAG